MRRASDGDQERRPTGGKHAEPYAFGIGIKKLQRHKNLSQRELAELVGISEGLISNIGHEARWVRRGDDETYPQGIYGPRKSLFDYSENDEFIRSGGGLKWRGPRKPSHLIVRGQARSSRANTEHETTA